MRRAWTAASTTRVQDGKGLGVWTTSGDQAPWLKEGGKGTAPIAFDLQFRPDPLVD
jgi:hypothetical protein